MKHALLLGEAPNSRVVPVESWDYAVAFGPVPRSGSGKWLRDSLRSPILKGWTFTLENAVTLHRQEKFLGRFDAVVALSRFVANRFDLPYAPHPANWKRFHSRDRAGWVRQLVTALNQ